MDKKLSHSKTSTFFLLVTLSLLHSASHAAIPFQELETVVGKLRSRGYNLFGNSIAVSDILHQILSGDNFTLLSPPDSSLFSLDMSTDAVHYVHSLRFHLIPRRRLSLSDLRDISLSTTPYLESLLPRHLLYITSRRVDYVAVDGVRISNPDVYLGPHIVVHGLDGALQGAVSPPGSIHGGLGFVPPPSSNNFPAAAAPAIGIPHLSMSPGSDMWFRPPPPGASSIKVAPVASSTTAAMTPPLDLDSILPLNRPLISPEIPQSWAPNSQDSWRDVDARGDSGPEGTVRRRRHDPYEQPPGVGSTPGGGADGFVAEIPDQYSPPWNSWTELIRDSVQGRPVQSAGDFRGKRCGKVVGGLSGSGRTSRSPSSSADGRG